MPVPSDPIHLILIAIVLWSFWASCVIRDRMTADSEGPRRDTMPSLVVGGAVGLPHPPRQPYCGLCGGPHDYDDCPLEGDAA